MGYYQRYEDTRLRTKADLSSDTEAGSPPASRFPPGVDPASLAAPDDHLQALSTDTFQLLQDGQDVQIDALTAAHSSYASRFASEPELSLSDRSQTLGPGKTAGIVPMRSLPISGIGEQVPAESEDCPEYSTPMLVSSLGNAMPSAVSSDCGLSGGAVDRQPLAPVMPGTVPPATADAPTPPIDPAPVNPVPVNPPEPEDHDPTVDPRTESGSRDKGSALTGFATCARDTLVELYELVTELLGLAGGGLAAAWETWGPGWWTDDDADDKFAQDIREIRDAFIAEAKAGLELLAALHVYFSDTLEGNSVFRALNHALHLIFTEQEWAELARAGRKRAEEIARHYRELWEEDADYAVGYLICVIGQMLIGGGALLKVVRQVRRRRHGLDPLGDNEPDLDGGNPKAPDNILDDPDGAAAKTPNGPAPPRRQREGQVSPEYRTPGDPDTAELNGGPDNGGVPRHGRPGDYIGDSEQDVRNGASANMDPRMLDDLIDETRSGQDLADAGYHVEQLDRRNQPHPGLQSGDYGYDQGSKRQPDFRVNGVIFDHFAPGSPRAMRNQIFEKLDKLQARNFVVRIGRNSSSGEISDYLSMLRTFTRRDGTPETRLGQVIIIDSRTGRIATWKNPHFQPN